MQTFEIFKLKCKYNNKVRAAKNANKLPAKL